MKIILPGTPCCQLRMRAIARGGFASVYDPCRKDKDRIKAEIRRQADLELFDHPKVSFLFYMPIPLSMPRKKQKILSLGYTKHERKPDIDNLVKLYLDCMDGILFEGDQKVTLGNCIKLYHPEPRTIIVIEELTDTFCPLELDGSALGQVFSSPSSSQKECQHESDSHAP